MSIYKTNSDKMLQAVISDERLAAFYDYNPNDYSSISDALAADNAVIKAMALIISKSEQGANEKEIFNEVNDTLKNGLI